MKASYWKIVAILLVGTVGCSARAPAPPLVVGQVASLSGPNKRAGIQASRGIRLALEELNKDTEPKIEVRHTDTRGNLDAFESQAVRLLSLNGARAFIGGGNPEELLRLDRAVLPETKEQPVFVPIISPNGWRTRAMSKQIFLTGMTPQAQARTLVRFAVEEQHVTRVTLLVDQGNERARIVAENFAAELVEACRKKSPGPEPARPAILFFESDLKLPDLLARIAADEPEAVLIAGSKAHVRVVNEYLTKISDDNDETPPILLYAGADGSLNAEDWPMVTQKGEGVIYLASAFGIEKGQEPIDEFVQRYRKQYQEDPDVHAALAYEGLKLLAGALREGPDLAKVREKLAMSKDFPGLAGPLSFEGDEVLTRPLFVLRLDRAQMIVMKKYP